MDRPLNGGPLRAGTGRSYPSWLRRRRQWAAFHNSRSTLVTLVTPIGNRDTRHEQFRPLTAASTLAQVARRAGPSLRSRCIVPSPHRRSAAACRSCEVEVFPPLEGAGKERDRPCGGRVSSSTMPSSLAMPACTILAWKAWSRLPPTITEERVMRTFEHLASASLQM